jgi:DNA processing protein
MDPTALAWLHLALTPGLGPALIARGVDHAGGPVEAAAMPPGWWARLKAVQRDGGPPARPQSTPIEDVLARADALGAQVLTPADPRWPRAAFQGLTDPPAALFLRGTLPRPDQRLCAVVGTRAVTPYGRRIAGELAEGLARRGVGVVSGLAVGVDAAAHAGALRAGAAPPGSLAVLGCGLGVSYPPENADLREDLAGRGAVISEYAPDVPPERWHFPQRNRLVAAFSQAVLVIEAPERSGALLTARLAVELGREVLAVPGPIGRATHEGCHALIRRGAAALCRGLDDALEALGLGPSPGLAGLQDPPPPAPGPGLAVWRVLDPDEALDLDEIARRSALALTDVAVALALLELEGRALRMPGVGYLRR